MDTVNYQTSGAQVSLPTVIHFNPATVTISAEEETDLAYYAVDRANNASVPQEATIKLDKTPPVTQIALTGTTGQNDWYTSNVTATLTSTDSLSGVERIEYNFGGASFSTYTQPVVISDEGNLLLFGRSIDVAGNPETPSVSSAFKIDKTAPVISINYPAPYAVLPVDVVLDFGAVDATSGIQSVTGTLSDGETTISVNSGAAISQAGIYTLVVQATDMAGLSASETHSFVVFDPEGGYVTGGGLIDSPAGAYQPDPSLSGNATFAFISKYVKGALTPTGTTKFQFHLADLNFFSDSYEWLVVNQSGTNAQFKGSGTINQAGSYKFMLWAGDGAPDSFRIKIWEEVNGVESVIYDNGVLQPISGGAIIIHKK